MAHNSTWDDIRYALAVAEAGSVNAAAKALGVNHATILRRVAAFEAATGVVLFRRSARGYAVDAGARGMLEAMRGVEAAVQRFERVAAGETERISGPAQITSTDSLTLTLLPRHVAAFQKAHAAITVTLISTNTRLNFARLDAEVAIRPARALPEDMTGDRVGTMRMRVYGSADYIASRPGGAAAQNWLGVSDLLSRSPVYHWQARLPQDRIVLRADSFVTLAAQARAGQGLAMLPTVLADGLERAPGFDDETATGVWVAVHPDLAGAPRIASCRRWFLDALSREPSLAD